MEKLPKISDSEWKVMIIVWKKHSATSTEIIDALKYTTQWSPKTIHTYIKRLVDKKILGVIKSEPINQYYPIILEEEYKTIETRRFIEKVYEGSLGLLISNFAKNKKLSEKEVEELRRLIDKQVD